MPNTHVRLLNGLVMDLDNAELTFSDTGGSDEVTCTLTFSFKGDGVKKFNGIPTEDEDRDGDIFLALGGESILKGTSAGYMTGSTSTGLMLHLPLSVKGIKRDLSLRLRKEAESK